MYSHFRRSQETFTFACENVDNFSPAARQNFIQEIFCNRINELAPLSRTEGGYSLAAPGIALGGWRPAAAGPARDGGPDSRSAVSGPVGGRASPPGWDPSRRSGTAR